MNREDAKDLNSECAFCKRLKFTMTEVDTGDFELARCTDEACVYHCKWNHSSEMITFDYGGPDMVAIASGWINR